MHDSISPQPCRTPLRFSTLGKIVQKGRIRFLAALTVCSIGTLGVSTLTLARADPTYPLNIPAQDLGSALKTFGVAVNEQILFSNDVVTGLRSTAVKGEYTTKAAISILLKGSGLQADRTPSGVLLIRRPQDPVSPQASTQAQVDGQGGSNSADKEGKKRSSGGFRVAQVDQGKTRSEVSVEQKDEQASKKKPVVREEVVVTGSRIPGATGQGAQDVQVYTREKIEQSGQTTVADFLNTLPDASISSNSLTSGIPGAATVQLHGLPVGTTLILINGMRVETNFYGFFDLGNVPLAAIERIDVLPVGSSAIYGSDALGGAVNLITRQNFNGLE